MVLKAQTLHTHKCTSQKKSRSQLKSKKFHLQLDSHSPNFSFMLLLYFCGGVHRLFSALTLSERQTAAYLFSIDRVTTAPLFVINRDAMLMMMSAVNRQNIVGCVFNVYAVTSTGWDRLVCLIRCNETNVHGNLMRDIYFHKCICLLPFIHFCAVVNSF